MMQPPKFARSSLSFSFAAPVRAGGLVAMWLGLGLASALAQQATLQPRYVPAKPSLDQLQAMPASNQVVVKFQEGTGVRLRSGQLTNLNADAGALQGVLSSFGIASTAIRRMHSIDESQLDATREQGQRNTGKQLADLNLYYIIDLPPGVSAAAVANRLNALGVVEHAEPAPRPAPLPVDIPPTTPDFTANQGYKNAAPTGVGVPQVANVTGSNGANVNVVDVEYSWQMDHEDLELPTSRIVTQAGCTPQDPFNNTDHGTAVLGEIVGELNAYGVTGITPGATALVSPSNCTSGFNPAGAITAASNAIAAGDVILIEQQAASCGGTCGADQVGCGPQESMQSVFDAISNATASGRIVVEAAGNGSVNLDGAACNGIFNRATRDSGAIIVGAGNSADRSKLAFSSFGSRVDVQAWGNNITTTGYGDAFNPNDVRQLYTNTFGGTSGASPIVTGVVTSIQGMRKACGIGVASPATMRTALASSGTAQTNPAGGLIGPLPRIREALAASGGNICLGISSAHDFNADGRSDIVWRNTTGDNAMWLMNGATISSVAGLVNVPTNWYVVGQRDFNGDGKTDLLWVNTTGDVAIWLMNGSSILSISGLGNVGSNWAVAGTADFNGDGKGDILWRSTAGDNAIWFMNGGTLTSIGVLGNVPTNWAVAGTADFNADGKGDILWRNLAGDNAIWLMNGATILSVAGLGNVPTNWSIVGTADFDGDGKGDIVWRNSGGDNAIWLMNGTTIASVAGLGNIPANWSIASNGDYNGDGKGDILWRSSAGDNAIWFMNGTTLSSISGLGNVPTNWTIQNAAAN